MYLCIVAQHINMLELCKESLHVGIKNKTKKKKENVLLKDNQQRLASSLGKCVSLENKEFT